VIFMDDVGTTVPRAPRQWVPAIVLDAVLGMAVAAVALLVVASGGPEADGRPLTWADGVAAVTMAGLILVRRRWPLPVLTVSAVLAVLVVAWTAEAGGFIATTVVAMYTVAGHTRRATAWLAGVLTALALYVAIVAWSGEGWFGPVGVVAWIGMATAIGDATRTRREYVAAIEERARRAEETRDEEARRRVAEERVRIARELHDVVAHHIAVINVHAGLAEHSVRTRPDQAEASLANVRQAAHTVLDELATILTVLRQTGDPEAPTDPVRGLSQLGELLDSMASAGLRVEHRQTGVARPLPPVADWAAYRIVQEGLTNAYKHGAAGTTELRIEYLPDALGIDISNPVMPGAKHSGSTGHGLTGMRERATAIGGTFTAGPAPAGRFHVHAVLPTAPQPEGTS
jgi:signal transduction histidine kinase